MSIIVLVSNEGFYFRSNGRRQRLGRLEFSVENMIRKVKQLLHYKYYVSINIRLHNVTEI